MTVMNAIEMRRSIRAYAEKPVEAEILNRVMEAGRLAPTAGNHQNLKLIAVADPNLKAKLGACGPDFIAGAPVLMAVCATAQSTMRCGQPRETIDASIALSFMMLEAAELGLGTCWIGHFDADAAAKVLALPPQAYVVALTPLGYPAESPDARPRKAIETIAEYR